MAKYAMLIDLRRCTGCHACAVACKSENEVPLGVFRGHVRYYEIGKFPDVRRARLPVMCNHCTEAACVKVCPTGASQRRADGIVFVDYDLCIGCKTCMAACPYGARFINPDTEVADKCTFCMHRVDAEITPACVNTCQGGARVFGDISEPETEISKMLASLPHTVLKPEQGTEPQVYYVGAPTSLGALVSPDQDEVV